ncbi:hypothetical protein RD792_004116 [Penstemon davidsonii]|uniref:L-ascorbate oxidase n=1 Tax=Penstemon davidsonii TaxID=160366 RepID=A0ABR0DGP2_9LAMI|nr:hypothetical protein RD792_004116 [Penstemon davidsonii]
MGRAVLLFLLGTLAFWNVSVLKAEDAYKYYSWTVTYGTASPLGSPQQVILINGQFPGPRLDTITNENIVLDVVNKLDQPFLLTWNGIKQRKNSWQDGVYGTNCPIPPNSNFTYKFQTKDQIGSYTYFPSTLMHRAAGGFGALNIYARSVIPVPYAKPAGDFSLLIGDWYKTGHKALQQILDSGKTLPFPDGILINGQGRSSFSGDQGKTYMFRISNVGLSTSFNFRIQGHKLKLVEVEGSNVLQNTYGSLDVHVGQSVTVLVTLDQSPKDYYIVASTRFTKTILTATSVLHYTNSRVSVSGPLPAGPTNEIGWSIDQARSYRWNLTSNAARPNPQGSFHYGKITTTRTIVLANSAPIINGKQRYAVNGVSYINPDTPLKLADYFNIPGVFSLNSIQSSPSGNGANLATSVMGVSHHEFIEVVFQNNEDSMQSWHLDGYDFWVVGFGAGQWTQNARTGYNLVDALTRHTTQVYPNSWTAILVSLDNQGVSNQEELDRSSGPGRFGFFKTRTVYRNPNGPGILINGQFPGPTVNVITNDNVIVDVENKLDEPLLLTWNGIKQRKSSWQDGVLGTNCPIPPNTNWTYRMQMKDQIGTYTYFPSTLLHRAAGGFGAFNILARPVIPVPYPKPYDEISLLISDWWKKDHKELQQIIDSGDPFPLPDGILINGKPQSTSFDVVPGQTYLFRVSNVGMTTSINFRIQGHTLLLVECEGAHTMQEVYDSLDIHVGQSSSFLVTLNNTGDPKDYFIIASTRFTKPVLTSTATLHYQGSKAAASGALPVGPTYHIHWSMKQARTIRWNLTANAARPNIQGSFHYGTIKIARTIVLENTAAKIDGKLKYAVNKVSYINPDTPLKLADYFNISGVFQLDSIKDSPPSGPEVFGTSVIETTLHDFVEIVFQNSESTIQSWHLDGYDFWSVGFGSGVWNSTLRRRFYNLNDATSRYTVQVYPYSWSAIFVSLDNKGIWNLRSANWPRRYLGQELYVRVWNDEPSPFTEYDIPQNALLCGKAAKH